MIKISFYLNCLSARASSHCCKLCNSKDQKVGNRISLRETNISFLIGVAIKNLNLDKHIHLYEYIRSTHKFIPQMTLPQLSIKLQTPECFGRAD